MTNPLRGNAFCFENCYNRRIIRWDEARCDPDSYEKILNIMQGTPIVINIKYKAHSHLQKSPLLVTGNYEVFPNDDRFNSILIRYNWTCCENLSNYSDKKPHLLAMGVIIDYIMNYNICNRIIIDEIKTNIFTYLHLYLFSICS